MEEDCSQKLTLSLWLRWAKNGLEPNIKVLMKNVNKQHLFDLENKVKVTKI